MKKKCCLYARVSTPEQNLETQFVQLRELAVRRGFEVIAEFSDLGVSGSKARRPGLDALLCDARRGKFTVVLVAAFDRLARSTRHFLETIDEFDSLGIEFISAREAIDTSGPMGRMFLTLLGSIAELERSFIVERIKAGMRRRKLEGFKLGRQPLDINHAALVHDRLSGMSLTDTARKWGVSRASVVRFTREAQRQQMAEIGGLPVGQEEVAAAVECIA